VSQRTQRSLDPTLRWITGITLFIFQFKFLLINESNFHITGFSHRPTTCDVVGRVSHSRAAFDVAVTVASKWILAVTTSSRSSRTQFQHSSPTFRPRIPTAIVVGTSRWRASPTVGNTSVDDTDTAGTATFFFPTDGKSIVPILLIMLFVIQAHVERLPYLSIYVFKCHSSSIGRDFIDGVLNTEGSDEGEGGGTDNDAAS
jgi:hypothetical protein